MTSRVFLDVSWYNHSYSENTTTFTAPVDSITLTTQHLVLYYYIHYYTVIYYCNRIMQQTEPNIFIFRVFNLFDILQV